MRRNILRSALILISETVAKERNKKNRQINILPRSLTLGKLHRSMRHIQCQSITHCPLRTLKMIAQTAVLRQLARSTGQTYFALSDFLRIARSILRSSFENASTFSSHSSSNALFSSPSARKCALRTFFVSSRYIRTSRFRLVIEESEGEAVISDMKAY